MNKQINEEGCKMFTRSDYMRGNCTHAQFYEQMVTDEIKNNAKTFVGMGYILGSKCEHFNDVPMNVWDSAGICAGYAIDAKIKETGDNPSLAGRVCVLKAAARIIKREYAELEARSTVSNLEYAVRSEK